MPSPFSGIIQDMRVRRGAEDSQSMALMRSIEMQQRAAEAERLRIWLMQNGPGSQRESRLRQHQQDVDAQNLAWSQAAVSLTPDEVPSEWRGRLANMQKMISTDPKAMAKVAENLVRASKPGGIQLVPMDTVDYDADGNPFPVRSYSLFDKGAGAMRPMPAGGFGATAPMGGGGGARPSVAAPPSIGTRRLSSSHHEAAADHFLGKYGASTAPPDLLPPGLDTPDGSLPE